MLTQEYSPAAAARVHHPPSSSAVTGYSTLDKIDAEASSILISLANHETTRVHGNKRDTMEPEKTRTYPSVSSNNNSSQQSSSSMSISNLVGGGPSSSSALTRQYTKQRERSDISRDHGGDNDNELASDPIMLLAAAAAAIDGRTADVDARMRKSGSSPPPPTPLRARSYSGSSHSLRTRRKPVSYNYEQLSDDQDDKPTQSVSSDHWKNGGDEYLRRRPSGGNHQRSKRTTDTITMPRHYVSMKHDPRIKRNAMHAYITYMIFNDMTRAADRPPRPRSSPSHGHVEKTTEADSRHFATTAKTQSTGLAARTGYQYAHGNASISNAQTYSSPVNRSQGGENSWQNKQQYHHLPLEHASPSSSSVMGRPLTTFLLREHGTYADRRVVHEQSYYTAPSRNLAAASTSTLAHR
ncbi:hypothetical protein VTP01DRAFT_10340 [Rhizomucor pusillus]|uniref:uncharacterized protein n=1 Tax=Rhizomucor pusillus TaxID=4840 RepID=UPI0037442030